MNNLQALIFSVVIYLGIIVFTVVRQQTINFVECTTLLLVLYIFAKQGKNK